MLIKLLDHAFVKRLRLEEFDTFCHQVESFVELAGGNAIFGANSKLNSEFRKAMLAYHAAIEHIRQNALTPAVEAADRKRDLAYTAWREQVRSAFKFPGGIAWHEKAAALQAIVDLYYKHRRESGYNEETGRIRNLVQDFETAPNAGYAADLKLNKDMLGQLKSDNEAFDKLYIERTSELAKAGPYDVPGLRATLEAALDDVLRVAAALAISAEYKGVYDTLTRQINELIAEYKATYDRRHTPRKKAGGEVETK
ncbi:MAG: DUF6261 family protein [Verrucomicrobiales bacterium]|jgi:hypothetical protein|nr:DUF6261 family protein [Verrucomicrobiales bacterium]